MPRNVLDLILGLVLSLGSVAMAKSVVQSLEGKAAFETYKKLRGVVCTEYSGDNYVALTKYGTKACSGPEFDKRSEKTWVCTVQGKPNDIKKGNFQSAGCNREIEVID